MSAIKMFVFLGLSASLFEEKTNFFPSGEKTGNESKVLLFVSLIKCLVLIFIIYISKLLP